MLLLEREYLNWRLQKYFDSLNMRQIRRKMTAEDLRNALKETGALQTEDSPEEENVFRWEFSLRGDESDPLFLKHCNIRLFYGYSGKKWEKRTLYVTMGMFSTFACRREDPRELAEELIRIDEVFIPQFRKDLEALSPENLASWALYEFKEQCAILRKKAIVMDEMVAHIYGVTVTDVRCAISRNKRVFRSDDEAFHLTYEEHVAWDRKYSTSQKTRLGDYRPYAITDRGFCMLSMHLHSNIAVKVSMGIVQTVAKNVPLAEMLKNFEECIKKEKH